MSRTGSISAVTLDDGTPAIQKSLDQPPPGFFAFEAAGLRALQALGARVPQVFEVTESHLVMQRVEATSDMAQTTDPEFAFGADLARLHLASRAAAAPDQTFGGLTGLEHWYLGAAEINLTPQATLYESLVINRILPLTRRAVALGALVPEALELAGGITEQHLGPAESPVVVHGDLWAGNRMIDSSGASWLIDPSCHWGHREQDLAMMQLFGGFGPAVFQGYVQLFPLAPGWQQRVAVFQLVPLLVHVLLFGASYAAATMRAFHQTTAQR